MLRDQSLIPLSRQHQHALALCVRVDRASPISAADLHSWQKEIAQQFELEIKIHFAAEERVVFPVARRFKELQSLVEDLFAEHEILRRCFAKAEAGTMSAADLPAFAQRLAEHIRKEERRLFERMQELLSADELAAMGTELRNALQDATQACRLPPEITKPREKR